MASLADSLVSRRSLLRLGALTGLATALSPVLQLGKAYAMSCYPPDRPKTPAEALNALIEGNQKWATFAQTHPGEDALRRTCVLPPPDGNGQMPFGAIISCSDSRVPPELVFDQGIGDVFVARVAGNGATGTLAESLYYGTSVLGSLVLFVLGHSDCGAVKEAVTTFPKHNLEFVKLLFPAVKQARDIVKREGGDPNDSTKVIPIATDQNVILEVQALRKSPFFKQLVSDGQLLIAGGVYDLKTQQVNILIQ